MSRYYDPAEFEADQDEDWAGESEPYQALRTALAPEYRRLPAETLEAILGAQGLAPQEMEFSLQNAFRDVGRFVQQAAPAVLPVAGTVLGTAFGGPLGAAVGGALGQAAGSAIGGARAPARPPQAGAGPMPAGPIPAGSPAAAQLLQILNRPELLQALTSMALGSAGRRQIPVGGTPVPAAAFTNLVGSLANQAAAEYHALVGHQGEGVPSYLLTASGEFAVDPSVPEQRAGRLLELLDQAGWEPEAQDVDWAAAEQSDLDAVYDEQELAEYAYAGWGG